MTIDHTPPSKGEAEFDAAVDKAYEARWWETHDNVTITAYWMAEDGGYSTSDMALLVEKPWKFTDAYIRAEAQVEEDGTPFDEDPMPPTFNEMLEAERSEAFATIDGEVEAFVSRYVVFITQDGTRIVDTEGEWTEEDIKRGFR